MIPYTEDYFWEVVFTILPEYRTAKNSGVTMDLVQCMKDACIEGVINGEVEFTYNQWMALTLALKQLKNTGRIQFMK